jgi:hypothetical protein
VQEAASIKRKQSSSKAHGQILLLKLMSFFIFKEKLSSDGFDAKFPVRPKLSLLSSCLPHDKKFSIKSNLPYMHIYILCMDPVKSETLLVEFLHTSKTYRVHGFRC